jgi:hypothetical protein
MSVLSVLLLLFLGSTNPTRAARLLEVLFEWKDVEFAFPSQSAKEVLIKTRAYIPGNSFPLDVDTWQQGKCANNFASGQYTELYPLNRHMSFALNKLRVVRAGQHSGNVRQF